MRLSSGPTAHAATLLLAAGRNLCHLFFFFGSLISSRLKFCDMHPSAHARTNREEKKCDKAFFPLLSALLCLTTLLSSSRQSVRAKTRHYGRALSRSGLQGICPPLFSEPGALFGMPIRAVWSGLQRADPPMTSANFRKREGPVFPEGTRKRVRARGSHPSIHGRRRGASRQISGAA